MDFLKACGYRSAYLWTTDELAAAAHLYTRAGFTLTEEKESTSFGKPLTERRYDLLLQESWSSERSGQNAGGLVWGTNPPAVS
jgi:hypothetical protein